MTCIDLASTGQRAFSATALPGLSQLRYSTDEQATNPDKPMTRLVKDVLRVGRWRSGQGTQWTVTRDTLREIQQNTRAAIGNGNSINLCMTHGGPDGVVHPLDLVAPIDQVIISGDTLYCSFYVTPKQAEMLRNPAMKVSVRATPKWTDGASKTYGTMLLHVAVCDLPVMARQDPFRDLATGANSMDPIIEGINAVLEALGKQPLPEGVTMDTLADTLKGLAVGLGGEAPVDDAPTDETPVLDDTGEMDPAMLSLCNEVRRLGKIITDMSLAGGERAFETKLTELGNKGVPAKSLEAARKSGKAHGWDLSLLTPLEEMGTIDMSRQGRKAASAAAPQIPATGSERTGTITEEQRASGVRAIGGR